MNDWSDESRKRVEHLGSHESIDSIHYGNALPFLVVHELFAKEYEGCQTPDTFQN